VAASLRVAARPGRHKRGELVRWNLRMKAAPRGIWKSTELRRRLAEAGLEISAGKMSGLWTGTPTTIRLEDLDVLCAVLECSPTDLLICEPDKVPPADRPSPPEPKPAAHLQVAVPGLHQLAGPAPDHRPPRHSCGQRRHLGRGPWCRLCWRTGPVGRRWIRLTLQLPPRALREDRILDEAHARPGDARRLCDLFAMTVHTAERFTAAVEHPDLAGDTS
jgi:putative transcriptional regulator